jgi:hypothetical protein
VNTPFTIERFLGATFDAGPRNLANEMKGRATGKIVRETSIVPGAEAR